MRALLFVVVAAALAACGSAQLPTAPGGSASVVNGASWMAPEAQKQDLLYVSDEGGSVYVFSYPGGKLVGALTGFQGPGGLCSDAAGDVFIADTPNQSVFEYEHGGKKPIRVVGAFGYPEGCAVDPKTGNLAVTTYQTARPSGPGNVTVYAATKKRQSTTYTDPSFNSFFFCGYDDKGSLYVDGVNSGTSQAQFAVLRRTSGALHDFKLNRNIVYPGGIQWDGGAVAVEDLLTDVIYRVKVAGSHGSIVGSTHLKDNHSKLLTQFWIQSGAIVSPSGKLARGQHKVGIWPYPSGGAPEKVFDARGSVELLGTTISIYRRN